eukprot:2189777-Rhodomonas_salina.1
MAAPPRSGRRALGDTSSAVSAFSSRLRPPRSLASCSPLTPPPHIPVLSPQIPELLETYAEVAPPPCHAQRSLGDVGTDFTVPLPGGHCVGSHAARARSKHP